MSVLPLDNHWALVFGILGNIISFMVYLAPIPTFYRICKNKSTGGFQALPYVIALFSAMLWIYYALVSTTAALLITINAAGCVVESTYIILFVVYAPRKTRVRTVKQLVGLNVGVFGAVLLATMLLPKGAKRVEVLGWFCVAFSVSVFAAPLSIIRLVIRTKSVEFMPFTLSLTLTLSAVAWFGYGVFIKDLHVALPNVLGFAFGVCQMVLYLCYKDANSVPVPVKLEAVEDDDDAMNNNNNNKLPEIVIEVVHLSAATREVHPVDELDRENENVGGGMAEIELAC